MPRFALSLLALAAGTGCSPGWCERQSERSGLVDPASCAILDELDRDLQGLAHEGALPGLGVALVAGGQVVFAEGYGWAHREADLEVRAETPFMLASVSKAITGTAVMHAVHDGLFDLDTPIADLLPFPVDNPRVEGEDLRVRHLVSHSSGLRDRASVWGTLGSPDALMVEGDSPIPLGTFLEGYFVPGGAWYDAERNFYDTLEGQEYHYSNIATALAGYLVEVASGLPFDDYCDLHIFEPLEMTHTGWHLEDHDPSTVAVPYGWANGSHQALPHFGYPDYPNGQLRASPRDLARFLVAHTPGRPEALTLLPEEVLDRMWAPVLPELEPTQGVFWYWDRLANHDVVGHNGSDYGVATDIYLDPVTGVGIVTLTNADQPRRLYPAMAEIEEALFKAGLDLTAP